MDPPAQAGKLSNKIFAIIPGDPPPRKEVYMPRKKNTKINRRFFHDLRKRGKMTDQNLELLEEKNQNPPTPPRQNQQNKPLPDWARWLIGGLIAALICFCCIGTGLVGAWYLSSQQAAEAPAETEAPAEAKAPAETEAPAEAPVPVIPTPVPFSFEGAQACPGEVAGCWTNGPVRDNDISFTCPAGYLCDVHNKADNRVYVVIGPWTGTVLGWTARPAPIGETAIKAACNQAKHLGSVIKSYEVTVYGQTCP